MSFDASYNTTSPGSAVGNREDLSPDVSIYAATSAPVFGLLSKETAKNTLFEWVTDTYDDPQSTGVVEGADFTDFDSQFSQQARLDNRTQRNARTFGVTVEQEAIGGVNPADYANAEEKAMIQVLRDTEFAICAQSQGAVAGTGAVGGKTRSLGKWISNSAQSDGATDVPADYRTPAASIHGTGALSESVVNGLVSSIWGEGGDELDLHLVADQVVRNDLVDKLTRVDSTATAIRYNAGSGDEVTYTVDLFRTPYGIVKIMNGNPKCMPGTTGYFLDPAMLSWKSLTNIGSTELQNQGGGRRGYVDQIGGLCVKNPLAFGKITAIS